MFKEVIVVEGRDDTRRLKEVYPEIETLETNGSAINEKILEQITTLQMSRGIIVFTDPDFPGNKIRQTVMQAVPNCKHAYLQKVDAIAKNGSGVGVGLIGHPNSAKIRQKLSEALGIGYVNGKQLQKRLMMFGITKQQVVDVLTDSN